MEILLSDLMVLIEKAYDQGYIDANVSDDFDFTQRKSLKADHMMKTLEKVIAKMQNPNNHLPFPPGGYIVDQDKGEMI